jgi:hypothetical protein
MTTQHVIERMILDRVTGRKIDLVGFIDQLLLLVSSTGEIRCAPVDDNRLRFTIANAPPFEVDLDHASGKLRMMCARLAVLSQGAGLPEVYGGTGWIDLPYSGESNCEGATNGNKKKLHVEFNNKPGDVWFTLRCEDCVPEPVRESEELRA